MASLKALFDAEQQKIKTRYTTNKAEEDGLFDKAVKPVMDRIVCEINKDPDLYATYKPEGDNGSYFIEGTNMGRDTRYDWGVTVFVQDRKDNKLLGRALVKLDGLNPAGLVAVPDPKIPNSSHFYDVSGREGATNTDKAFAKMAEDVVLAAAQDSVKDLTKEMFASARYRRKPPF